MVEFLLLLSSHPDPPSSLTRDFALFLSVSLPLLPVAKISILGNSDDIVKELAKEVPMASLPAHVGGPYQAFNPPLAFETHAGGALHCPAAVAPTPAEV